MEINMGLVRYHFVKWSFVLLVPFLALLVIQSSAYSQWTSVTPPTLNGEVQLLDVHFTSVDEGWAVGRSSQIGEGTLLHYQNGTWTSVAPPTRANGDLIGVHFTSADEGWAVGQNLADQRGSLLHYKNGIWTFVAPPNVSAYWYLWGVHFTSADEGWAVGYDDANNRAVLLHYQGGIWTSVTPPTFENFNLERVHFTSADEGWAVGYDTTNGKGVLFHYEGGNWTSVTPPTVDGGWALRDLHFTSANEGWAVGHGSSGPILLHYQGGTWTWVTPPDGGPNGGLYSVHFTSPDEGWAVGYGRSGPILLHYQRGTWTWVTSPMGAPLGLYGVHFTSPTEGWAVGWDFTVPNKGILFYYNISVLPNEGTIGTQLTIAGTGFGAKKGKVLIGDVTTKIAKDGWSDNTINCTVTKVLPPGEAHDVTIMAQPYKTTSLITIPGAFTVMNPKLDPLLIDRGIPGTEMTITGNFFSTKKGRVYLEYQKNGQIKKKNCKVTYWFMDAAVGLGEIRFVVPKGLEPGTYPLGVTNKVGGATTTFTIDSWP